MRKKGQSAIVGLAVTLFLAMLNPHRAGGDMNFNTTINAPVTVILAR